jgi:hypothetical protein
MYIDCFISAIHHIVGLDPEAVVPSHLAGVQGPARDGTACHNMINMEETAESPIEIMLCLMGGGGTHVFPSPFSFLQEVTEDLCKRWCVSLSQAKIVLNDERQIQ